jgi:hypothetical protein
MDMVFSVWFTGSRVFLLLGCALVVFAVVTFPMRIALGDQTEPLGNEDLMVGWLFSPIIGVWGLASISFGLAQSSMPKRTAESCLLFISAVVCVALAFAVYLAGIFGSGVITNVGKADPFFWIYFSLVLAPSIVIISSTVKFIKTKEKLNFLFNRKVRDAAFAALAVVPLAYSVALATFLNLL